MTQQKYHQLDPDKITQTLLSLSKRIDERFSGSGLFGVSQKLHEVGTRAKRQANWIARPIYWLRFIIMLLICALIGLIVLAVMNVEVNRQIKLVEFIQVVEAGINDMVLVSLAIFFLATAERRIKRVRALRSLHELRSIAHLIDMHQLTKDPDRLHWENKGVVAAKVKLTPFQLTRYLDYCSEMLSLVGKIAVLYVQDFDDPVALSAVNDVENLTTGLSRKIWQKLMVIHRDEALLNSPTPTENKNGCKKTDADPSR